jgi:hypothetical protein
MPDVFIEVLGGSEFKEINTRDCSHLRFIPVLVMSVAFAGSVKTQAK